MTNKGVERICIFFSVTAIILYALAVNPQPAGAMELKGVTFLPSRVPSVGAFFMLQEKVKNLSNGDVKILHKGGPEVIPGNEQAMAAKRGVVDLAWVPAGRYLGLVPGLEAMELSRLTALEERESGFYDVMVDLHQKAGLYYLGRGMPLRAGEGLFYIFTNKRVAKPEELAGQKIGRGVLFLDFLKAMGIVSVSLKRGEEYTALETGLIDGVISAVPGIVGYSGHEVVKYAVDHPFGVYNVMTLINLKTWNKLSEKEKKVLVDAQIEVERDWPAEQTKINERSKKKLLDAGVEPIKFSLGDAERYVDTAYDAQWNALIQKKYPDLGPQLRKLSSK
jgi:TRAP-type C4-dicarboxylate transport system substrate-binding protein